MAGMMSSILLDEVATKYELISVREGTNMILDEILHICL